MRIAFGFLLGVALMTPSAAKQDGQSNPFEHLVPRNGAQGQAGAAQEDPWSGFRLDEPWGNDTPEFSWRSETEWYWIFQRDIRRDDHGVTVWLNREFFTERFDNVQQIQSRLTFDCADRVRYSAETTYRADGTVIQSFDRLDDWQYIRPGSPFQTIAEEVCRS